MLKPTALHILLALADRDSHGYALMQAIREQSAGQVAVQTASFYRHLSKLMEEGLVAEAAGRPAEDDARRSVYLPDHAARATNAGGGETAPDRARRAVEKGTNDPRKAGA